MANDAIGAVNKAETVVILVAIAAGVYFLYQFYGDITDFINGLFGVDQGAGSYANAATQTLQHPIGTIGSIAGVGAAYPSSTSGGVVTGTAKIGASGQHYRCNDTQCFPISIDANGNELVSGVPVPVALAN
jgi:hypothetical protein